MELITKQTFSRLAYMCHPRIKMIKESKVSVNPVFRKYFHTIGIPFMIILAWTGRN